jgi:hypothetical protein
MAKAADFKLTSFPAMESYVSNRIIAVNFSENHWFSGCGKLQDNNVMCLWGKISAFSSVLFLQPFAIVMR